MEYVKVPLRVIREKPRMDKKAELLREHFQGKPSFTISDAASVLEEKQSTLYWTLYNLARNGYIYRTGQGLYSFQNKEEGIIQPILSRLANRVLNVLKEKGYDFFISGLDILSVFMDHVPETYPVLLFVEKYSTDEIIDILSKNRIDALSHIKMKDYTAIRRMSSVDELVLLISTQEFSYAKNGLASFEKAFVDIYYEVSRRDYPLPIQELVRIYLNMKRRISLNTNRMVKIASRRNIQQDIRYIVEHDAITDAAIEFVSNLRKRTE